MSNNEKMTCKMFEHDIWLYIDRTLGDEKMEFWRRHLNQCNHCREILSSTEGLISTASEKLVFDIDDSSFDRMIGKSIKSNRYKIFPRLFGKRGRQLITVGKVVFASVLVVAAILISLMSDKPNSIKTVSRELLDWEGAEIRTELNDIGSRIELIKYDNLEGWNREVNGINSRLNNLETNSDPESFY
ncbi:MAG TPA: hypothetical protein PLZ15_05320 [Melioribacteraceae bacterium]|nr:hypothetical protein [Melioribacteraceae bacterium]